MEKETTMLLDALHQGLTITDAEGRLVYMSDSFAEFFGINKNEAIGRNIRYYENINVLKPSVTRLVLEQKKTVKVTQSDKKGRELLCTGVPVYEENELKYVVCFNAWECNTPNDLKLKYEVLKAENDRLEAELNNIKMLNMFENRMVAQSRVMQDNLKLASKVANVKTPLYIWGSEGSGKKRFAKSVCEISKWNNERVENINCSIFPEKLTEQVLFGSADEQGILNFNSDGMLIIENIEEMSKYVQLKLKRYIDEEKGVRVAALSQFSLEQLYNEGKIIAELFHSLSVISINIPPLCERVEDLKQFIDIYLETYNKKYNRNIFLTPAAYRALLKYNWPNNVSQVKFVIERIVLTNDEDKVDAYNLPKEISINSGEKFNGRYSLKNEIEAFEREIVVQAYNKYKTTVGVAEYLDISQASAVRKLQKYVDGYKK